MPICTIAIPVYNRQDNALNFGALESALAEPLSDLEILVVDDCSTDGTWERLQRYHDPRLRLVRNQVNLGLFGNFNRCLQLARGKYLRLLCTDDRLVPGALRSEIEVMENNPSVALLSTRGARVRPDRTRVGLQADHLQPGIYEGAPAIAGVLWFKAFYGYNPLNYPSGVLFRREVAVAAGSFDVTMRMSGDVDFFLRVLTRGRLAVCEHVGCEITEHEDQQGTRLTGNAVVLEEDYLLVERFREFLLRAGLYEQVLHQLGGVSLGLAQKCWRAGNADAGRQHLAVTRRHGTGGLRMCLGLARLVGLRLLLKTTGVRSRPVLPDCGF
jgi:hypothetical protein